MVNDNQPADAATVVARNAERIKDAILEGETAMDEGREFVTLDDITGTPHDAADGSTPPKGCSCDGSLH